MNGNYTLVSINKGQYGQIADGILIEKKSKFISYIFSISSKEEATKYIADIKNENKEARHVVYIYSYLDKGMENVKFCDDGEPQGTGTRAIYELLKKERITNICIVIVRYFGGILLGAGPLSRAYLNSAKDAILKCEKELVYTYTTFEINSSYNGYNAIISKACNVYSKDQIKVINTNFDTNVTIEFLIRDDVYNEVASKIEEYGI